MKSDIFPPTSETTVMHQEDDLFTPKQCLQQYFYVDTGGLPSVLMNNLYNTHKQVRLIVFPTESVLWHQLWLYIPVILSSGIILI